MKTCFIAQNVNEPIAGCQFERFAITGGTTFGVYATENPEEVAKLEALVGKSSVQHIDETEYLACLKKKPPGSPALKALNAEQNPGASIRTPTAVVVDTPPPQELPAPSTAVAVEDALKVATVDVPVVPIAPETPKRGRRSS